ncbi:hypothetical protein [Parablautia intestinalis]|uniref:hypothetical protein n=1 Tax=Parablautia intestinalis TaxID=2320100 RepID=UPI00259CBB74|nr:hypothetical protein [Parablautia intestinalis]
MKVNASKAIPPEQLGIALAEVLTDWADNQEKEFVKVIDEAAEACDKEIKQHLDKGHGLRTGNYRDHFEVGGGWEGRHHYSREWHVSGGEYRLTHLLENGHAIRDGTGRKVADSPAIKHIKYGRKIAEQVLDERLKGL